MKSKITIHFLLVLLIFYLKINLSYAQKEDFVWTFGYAVVIDSLSSNGGFNIDFNTNPPSVYRVNRKINFLGTSSSICDSEGRLIAYSNGCQIANASNEYLERGERILSDQGQFGNFLCKFGFTLYFSTLMLPVPESGDECVSLFHFSVKWTGEAPEYFYNDTLFITLICKDLVQKEFRISELKKIVDIQNFMNGYFTATKHANGKDWWIVQKERWTNKYLLYLLKKDGKIEKKTDYAGENVIWGNCYPQNKFSPDGRKYAWFDPCIGLYIMDFDRRAGVFSNPVLIPTWTNYNIYSTGGMEFSPNSRFIYCTTQDSVWQLDLHSKEVAESRTLVQVWDGFRRNGDGIETNFLFAQSGPDGKIYITNLTNYIHVINKPNLKGTACDFRQRGIVAPTVVGGAMPYFPNYRLGALPDIMPEKGDFIVTPNPSMNQLQIHTDLDYISVKLFDITGREFFVPFDGAGWVDLSNVPAGVYILALYSEWGTRLAARRVVKM